MHVSIPTEIPEWDVWTRSLSKDYHWEDPAPEQAPARGREACWEYNNGLSCTKASCHNIHDDAVRDKAIEKRTIAATPNKKRHNKQSPPASDITLQKNLDGTKSKEVCRKFIQGNCTRHRCPFIHNATARDIPKAANDLFKQTSSQNASFNNNKLNSADPSPEKKHPSSAQQNQKRLCRNFAKGYCSRGNDCRYSHDIPATKPKTEILPTDQNSWPKKSIVKEALPMNHGDPGKSDQKAPKKLSFKKIQAAEQAIASLKNQQPKMTYATVVLRSGTQNYNVRNNHSSRDIPAAEETTVPKKDLPVRKSYSAVVSPPSTIAHKTQGDVSKMEVAAKPIAQKIAPPPELPNVMTTNLGIGASWDSITLKKWAEANLRPEVLAQYLKAYGGYLDQGVIPVAALHADPSKPRPKVRKAKFRNFGILPFELREQIWNYALDHVHFDCRVGLRRKTHDSRLGLDPTIRITRCGPSPQILKVNHELRELALKRWERKFPTKTSSVRHCFFNFANDRLFFNGTAAWQLIHIAQAILPQDRCRVRSIAIPLRDFVHGSKEDFIKTVMLFKNLEELWIVVGDSKEDEVYSKSHFTKAVWEMVRKAWIRTYAGRRVPSIWKQIIPALRAKYYGIDGLIWDAKVFV
ncbi:uncharacterized protein BP5553_04486 [Venustampulla echinocandica]|uniref:C3H1-type domain-containing protein n=1 Tax=Venustampulla echinocandica TaxID=2656787 RepID=A0A370TNE7_9HELO|nr:uncharacterized protein BP5553_04486 [Venustampulla echinocandica]RDL37053.1 hypothetical protein BP5553_04486 [Venustampulla echinocandica]